MLSALMSEVFPPVGSSGADEDADEGPPDFLRTFIAEPDEDEREVVDDAEEGEAEAE
jgi:hypothetical protein